MPLPYYVSPEQMMKDKAEYARKGIARGRSMIALEHLDGILLVAENPSTLLHKISEIYDRIAFGGVGKYNEFENLRIAGIRHADIKGYAYCREDVTAKALANAYSQALGSIFTERRTVAFCSTMAIIRYSYSEPKLIGRMPRQRCMAGPSKACCSKAA